MEYSTSESTLPIYRVAHLKINTDSTFLYKVIDYQDHKSKRIIDSNTLEGVFEINNKKLKLYPANSVNHFCLVSKKHRLFFYACQVGDKIRLRHPLKKIPD